MICRHFNLNLILVCIASALFGADFQNSAARSLETYLHQLPVSNAPSQTAVNGNLWDGASNFQALFSDSRARRLHDLVLIRLSAQTVAQASGAVATKRSLDASSGIGALAGKFDTSGISSLFSPTSKSKLDGQAQATSRSNLQSVLTGEVVAILHSGQLVVEARRSILLNNQRETVVIRGIVRPDDIGPDNSVSSMLLGSLEIELRGKGIITDSTRAPNWLIRTISKVLLF